MRRKLADLSDITLIMSQFLHILFLHLQIKTNSAVKFDQVKVIDTVGCGDSFVAAVAFGFIHDIPLISTLAIATAMGSGAGRNVATLKQVIELIKAPNLNEDDEFWSELLGEHFNIQEITFLKKVVINGNNNRMNLIALQRAVSDLLPKLESVQLEGKASS